MMGTLNASECILPSFLLVCQTYIHQTYIHQTYIHRRLVVPCPSLHFLIQQNCKVRWMIKGRFFFSDGEAPAVLVSDRKKDIR